MPRTAFIAGPPAHAGLYTHARWLSLDVAVGSLGGAVLAARALRVAMPWAWYAVLPLAVWSVYTLDHLLDARIVGEKAHTHRHLFHHRHRKPLTLLWLLVTAATLVIALELLTPVGIAFGLAMSSLVLAHLTLVWLVGKRTSPLLAKELGVAIIYTFGIWGLPLLRHRTQLNLIDLIPVGQFFMLAMVNLLAFSLFERKIDAIDGQTSFVRAIGSANTRRLIYMLLILIAIAAAPAIAVGPGEVAVITQATLLAMAAMLAALLVFPRWFVQHERYRTVGDGVFLLPLLLAP